MPTVRLGLLTLPLAGLLVTWAAIASSAFFDFSDTAIDRDPTPWERKGES